MAITATSRLPSPTEFQARLLGVVAMPVVALAAAFVLLAAIDVLGPLVVVLPVAVPAAWYLVRHPDHALFALVFSITVFEDDASGTLGFTDRWFRFLPGLPVQPTDVLVACLAGGLVLDFVQHRHALRVSRWLWLPIPFLLAGLASGTAIGYLGGADMNTLLNSFRVFALLLVVPIATAVAVDHHRLVDRLVRLWFVLVVAKCAVGVAAWLTGQGRGLGDTRITYYTPTMNFDAMVVILAILALVVEFGRRTVTRGQWVGAAFALLSLTLALRRSFWIGLAFGVVLVVLVASGRRGRPWVVLGGALVLVAGSLMLSAGGATNSDNPVVQRAEIRDDAEDRYRLDEQRNVFDEIERHRWTGIGLGVPWEARHPLSLEFGAGRNYTHVAVFFFWLKLGPIGVLGYLLVIGSMGALGVRLWRLERAHHEAISAAGLALGVSALALMVIELTGTFTGASGRFTTALMITFGWLSAAVVRAEAHEAASVRVSPPTTRPAVPLRGRAT